MCMLFVMLSVYPLSASRLGAFAPSPGRELCLPAALPRPPRRRGSYGRAPTTGTQERCDALHCIADSPVGPLLVSGGPEYGVVLYDLAGYTRALGALNDPSQSRKLSASSLKGAPS